MSNGRWPQSFWQNIDSDAPRLIDRVDFVGLAGSIGRGALLALVSMLAASVLVAWQALSNLYQAIEEGITGVVFTVFGGIGLVQQTALEAARDELVDFGLFALPVSTAVTLSVFLVIAIIVAVFLGED